MVGGTEEAKVIDAVERALLGESMRVIASTYREELLSSVGLDPDEAGSSTFAKETVVHMGKVSRRLGERHAGDPRAEAALREWVMRVDDYEAFDALLGNWSRFDGREMIVRRGRELFPGPLTAHWDDEGW